MESSGLSDTALSSSLLGPDFSAVPSLSFQDLYRSLLDGVGDIVYVVSTEGLILSLNNAFEGVLGWPIREWLGQHFAPLIHKDDLSLADSLISDCLSGVPLSTRTLRVHRKGGEIATFEVSGMPLVAQGSVAAIMGVARDVTERLRIEEQRITILKEQAARREAEDSQRRYREIAEAMPQIVWTANVDGAVDYGNRRWEEYTGTVLSAGVGDGWLACIHPEDRERVSLSWQETMKGGLPYEVRYRLRGRDGSYRWFLARSSPVRDPFGRIRRWIGTCTDIDDTLKVKEAVEGKRRAEEDLAWSETRYRLLARATSESFWDWDLVTDRVERNESLLRLYGYSQDEVSERIGWWEKIVHPDDRARVVASIYETVASAKPVWECEYRLQKRDGSYGVVSDRGFLVCDSQGKPIRMVGAISDVTDQKKAESAMRRLKLVSDNASDAQFIVAKDEHFIYANKAACSLLKWAEEELYAKRLSDVWGSLLKNDISFSSLISSLRDSPIPALELQMIPKEGACIPMEVGLTVVDFEGDTYLSIVARTIAERKAQEALLRQNSEILARSNTELEQFAYVASHDLKEPLRMIKSYLQLLERRSQTLLDKECREFVQFAEEGASRLYALIDDLLAYCRVRSSTIEFEIIDLTRTIHDCEQNLAQLIQETEAEISYSNLPLVHGSSLQIRAVFQNLIANALKFKSENRPCVSLEAVDREEFWEFRVRDNGIGMDSQYFDRIFVIFQRLHTRESYPGTGIGLAICKKIVEQHGGKIWVESAPGDGSTFHFTLPKNVSRSTT